MPYWWTCHWQDCYYKGCIVTRLPLHRNCVGLLVELWSTIQPDSWRTFMLWSIFIVLEISLRRWQFNEDAALRCTGLLQTWKNAAMKRSVKTLLSYVATSNSVRDCGASGCCDCLVLLWPIPQGLRIFKVGTGESCSGLLHKTMTMSLTETHGEHITSKTATREGRQRDRESATHVLCFDLENVKSGQN